MPGSGDRMPITIVEEERVSDFGFIEFLCFLKPLNAMKEDQYRSKEGGRKVQTFGFANSGNAIV